MPEFSADIERLLKASMQAHDAARQARRAKNASAGQLLQQAQRLRLEALALDPQRLDEAWTRERGRFNGKDIHVELMAFYAQKISE